ncbi:MAG TPA: hypothetical protein VK766_09465 [Cytophagaceae bacterium]|nr:hypothetical protein [Cytophagaceae bacterium]
MHFKQHSHLGKLRRVSKKIFLDTNWWYWIPGILMFPAFVLLYSRVHNTLNPDLIAYFSVARHYQEFNWIQAFNSYWSPLICWLLALIPSLKSDPMTSFRIVNIVAAFALYHQLYFWIRLVVNNILNRFLLCLLLATLFVQLALFIGTPDFLSLLLFLIFLKILIRYRSKTRQSVFLGLSILLCFFSKTFLLLLCLSIVGVYFFYIKIILKEKLFLKPLLLTLIVVATGLFIWASCLKMHYGYYTLSSASTLNNSVAIPSQEPFYLAEPPFPKSLFLWEDPVFIKVLPAYLGAPGITLKDQFLRWKYNWKITLYYFQYISFLWIWILILPIIGLFQKRNRQLKICLLLFTVFLMNWFGYFLIFIHERYLIVGQAALYMSIFGFMEIILRKNRWMSKYKYIQIIPVSLLFISMVKNPVHELRYGMSIYTTQDHYIHQANALARSGILKEKKIATFSNSLPLYDYLSLACFLGGGKYYGEVWVHKPHQEQWKEINRFKVDYIAVYDCDFFDSDCDKKNWLSSLPIVYQDPIIKVKLLAVH